MSTELEEIAEVIINDWDGAGYIKEPDVLARSLEEKFKPVVDSETIAEIAKFILNDFGGPGHYKNQKKLVELLKSKLEIR